MVALESLGSALHHAGRFDEARSAFASAERVQDDWRPGERTLGSWGGFEYRELLLRDLELAAWRKTLELSPIPGEDPSVPNSSSQFAAGLEYDTILSQAKRAIQIARTTKSMLDSGLSSLTLVRGKLYFAVVQGAGITDTSQLALADVGIRQSGCMDMIPHVLLTQSWFRVIHRELQTAQIGLDNAWDIAERGPMRLHMADIHLYRARLFFREKVYPWTSPEADLAAAEKLINECGYHRRDEELADAKHAILGA